MPLFCFSIYALTSTISSALYNNVLLYFHSKMLKVSYTQRKKHVTIQTQLSHSCKKTSGYLAYQETYISIEYSCCPVLLDMLTVCSASKEILSLLGNQVHYDFQVSLPLVPILSQIIIIHTIFLYKSILILFSNSSLGLPPWSLSFRFSG
jgi:hypothetical protein